MKSVVGPIFFKKNLLKKEICESHEQYIGPIGQPQNLLLNTKIKIKNKKPDTRHWRYKLYPNVA